MTMLTIGSINQLNIDAQLPFGFQLVEPESGDTVILPSAGIDRVLEVGQTVDAFVFTDEDGQPSATLKTPNLQLGQVKVLKAVGATAFGAFFDWGIERDLLVPKEYQETTIDPGMRYPVYCFADDRTGRLLGATKLHYFLRDKPAYLKAGQVVELLVYAKTDLGFKVVINEQYLGLIFHSDAFRPLTIGEATEGVIKTIRPDGKIDVGLQRTDQAGRDSLQQAILDDLDEHGGISTLTDKSSAESIYSHFGVSKRAYKNAIGALYKARLISLDKDIIKKL